MIPSASGSGRRSTPSSRPAGPTGRPPARLERRGRGADVVHQLLAGLGDRLDVGHDGEPRAAVAGEPGRRGGRRSTCAPSWYDPVSASTRATPSTSDSAAAYAPMAASGRRSRARPDGHDRQGRRLVRREVRADLVLDLPARAVVRQDPVVGSPNATPRNGDAEQQQQRDHADRDRHGPAHDERGDPVPEPRPDLVGVAARGRQLSTRWPSAASSAGRHDERPEPARATTAMPA